MTGDMEIVLHSRTALFDGTQELQQSTALALPAPPPRQRSWLARLFSWLSRRQPEPEIKALPPPRYEVPRQQQPQRDPHAEALKKMQNPMLTPSEVDTLFVESLRNGYWDVAREGIKKGADVDMRVAFNTTYEYRQSSGYGKYQELHTTRPLINDIIHSNAPAKVEAVRFLLEHGVKTEEKCGATWHDALLETLAIKDNKIARLILAHRPHTTLAAETKCPLYSASIFVEEKNKVSNSTTEISGFTLDKLCEKMQMSDLRSYIDANIEKPHVQPQYFYNKEKSPVVEEAAAAPEVKEEEKKDEKSDPVVETWRMNMFGHTIFGAKPDLEEVRDAQNDVFDFMKDDLHSAVIPKARCEELSGRVAAHRHLDKKIVVIKDGEERSAVPYAVVAFDKRSLQLVPVAVEAFLADQERRRGPEDAVPLLSSGFSGTAARQRVVVDAEIVETPAPSAAPSPKIEL